VLRAVGIALVLGGVLAVLVGVILRRWSVDRE
jgi:hypothetical protein